MYGSNDIFFPFEDGIDMKTAIGNNASLIILPKC